MARDTSWLSKTPTPILPSPEEAALAIAILKSKPADVAVRDYVLQLRQHIKWGPRPSQAEQHRHVDLVDYWQDQYHLAREECERLRNINVKLERSNQILSNQGSVALEKRPSTPVGASNQQSPASPSRSPKRRKSPAKATTLNPNAQTQDIIESDFDIYEGLGLDGENLIESIHSTHRWCRTSEPHAEVLCHSLWRTASSLGKVIRVLATNYERLSKSSRRSSTLRSLGDDKSDFAHALTAAARAFMSILVGVSRMTDMSEDTRLPALIICELLEMFKATLSSIERCTHRSAELAISAPLSPKKDKSSRNGQPFQDSASARSLAHFLIGLLGLLDANNIFHQQLFDGFMYLLLERAASRMHFCTFGGLRPGTGDDAHFPSPQSTPSADQRFKATEALALRMEVKVLILILQRAMGLAPHHMKQGGKDSTSSGSTRLGRTLSMKTLPSAPRTRLSMLAKDRLQRTLVTCMFGSKQDDEFLDILTKPVPSMRASSLPNSARIDEEGVEQWYKEELWRLVGWDIMAREGMR